MSMLQAKGILACRTMGEKWPMQSISNCPVSASCCSAAELLPFACHTKQVTTNQA